MTLKEANYEVEKLNNELDRLLNEKEILESSIGIKSIDIKKENTDGGKRVDKILEYVSIKEIKDLDRKILLNQEKIENFMNWIEKELRILKKYSKIEQLIVYYKENNPKNYTWANISRIVNYSIPQCKRIYKKYKNKRFFENDTIWYYFYEIIILWIIKKVMSHPYTESTVMSAFSYIS